MLERSTDCATGTSTVMASTYASLLPAGLITAYRTDAQLGHPPPADIEAYISTFAPAVHPSKSLTSFAANAKKSSLRASIAEHLLATRLVDPTLAPPSSAKKKKKTPSTAASASNPALFFWAWTCRALHWAGPLPPSSPSIPPRSVAHPTLPILMHHFGCVIPSPEAISILARLAALPQHPHGIADVGSGTGYWTAVLRAEGVAATPIDNAQSEFRASWLPDTVHEDGAAWLQAHEGGRGHVLLMVYPVVGGEFVKRMMDAYEGMTVVVAGAQDRSGYTAFRDRTFGQWMEEEEEERRKQGWRKMAQLALPGWQGKDEALFVYQRGLDGGEGATAQ